MYCTTMLEKTMKLFASYPNITLLNLAPPLPYLEELSLELSSFFGLKTNTFS